MSVEGQPQDQQLTQLLAAVGQGDSAAFGSLIEATGAQVYGALMRFTGDEVAATALLRATYAEVWRLAPCYDRQAGPVGSWVLALCRAQIVDDAQKRRGGDFAPRGPLSVAPLPEDFDVLERCWFGGLRTGPAGLAERERFATALRRLAGIPLQTSGQVEG